MNLRAVVEQGQAGLKSLTGLIRWDVLLKGSALAFLLQILGTAVRYVHQVVLARWLGPYEFGVYSYVYNWVTLLAVAAGLGFSSSALRFLPEFRVRQAWGLLRGFVLRSSQVVLGSSGAIALVAMGVFWLTRPGETRLLLLGGIWMLPVIALMNHQGQMLRGLKDVLMAFGPSKVLQPLLALLAVGLLRAGGLLTDGSALLALTASMGLVILVQQLGLKRILPGPARSAAPQYETRAWFKVSLPMLVTAMAYAFITQIDMVAVGFFLPADQVGVYSAAGRTASMVSFILVSVNAIVAPHIAELHALQERKKLRSLARTATLGMFVPVLAVTIFLVVLGKPVLGLFGPAFVQGYGPLMVLVVGQLINALTGPVGYITELTGNQAYSAKVFFVCAGLSLVLNGLLIPLFGIMGAAFATTSAVSVCNLWLYWFVYSRVLR